MADRIEQFQVTVPAGTLASALMEIPMTFNPGELEEIEIVVPDGHAGLTGIALALAHQVLVPATRGQYITSNDEVIHWPVANFPNSGAWSAFVYNSDVFDHSWYVRFLIRELGSNVHLVEPTAPGEGVTIGIGSGDLGSPSDSSGDVIDLGDSSGDVTDTTPPPDDTGDTSEPVDDLPADDTGDSSEPIDDSLPPDDTGDSSEPVDTAEPPVVLSVPAPAPPPPVIATYGLPIDYNAGAVPLFGNPGNIGMLIGTLLGYKLVGSGNSSSGAYNTWRFFSSLGNTYDWNFYTSGAKRLQWVGPFNLRTNVPAG